MLEAGCGTGQLTAFLSIANRTVVGADMCLNSLTMAKRFRDANALRSAHFMQMNLFRPCFQPAAARIGAAAVIRCSRPTSSAGLPPALSHATWSPAITCGCTRCDGTRRPRSATTRRAAAISSSSGEPGSSSDSVGFGPSGASSECG